MIKFYVDEQVITLKVNKVIASDTINFVQLNFVFCPVWEGLNKVVQFTQETRTYSINLGTEGTTCYLPNEITDGLCAISVFGFNDNNQRITTVPYQVRIRRSGFMEDSIIPSDTPITVIEQLIQDTNKLKEDVSGLKEDTNVLKDDVNGLKENVNVLENNVGILKTDVSNLKTDVSDLKSTVATISQTNPNCLAEAFDLEFSKGYHTSEIDVYYDKTTNKLTINGTATKEITIGATNYSRKAFLSLGCYEFVNCPTGNIFTGTTSSLPFKLRLKAWINKNSSISGYATITDKTTAAAEPNTYNKLKRDCFVGMALVIPAGSSFDNEEFYPWLVRYSAYVE